MWQSSNHTSKKNKGNGKIFKHYDRTEIEDTLKEAKLLEDSLSKDSVRLDNLIKEITRNTRPPSL